LNSDFWNLIARVIGADDSAPSLAYNQLQQSRLRMPGDYPLYQEVILRSPSPLHFM